MSVWSAIKGFFVVSSVDVSKEAAAIRAKAEADVASLQKSATVKAASTQHAADVAAAERVLAVVKASASNPTPASTPAP